MRVLLVEDDLTTAHGVSLMLQAVNAAVEHAETGEEAIDLTRAGLVAGRRTGTRTARCRHRAGGEDSRAAAHLLVSYLAASGRAS